MLNVNLKSSQTWKVKKSANQQVTLPQLQLAAISNFEGNIHRKISDLYLHSEESEFQYPEWKFMIHISSHQGCAISHRPRPRRFLLICQDLLSTSHVATQLVGKEGWETSYILLLPASYNHQFNFVQILKNINIKIFLILILNIVIYIFQTYLDIILRLHHPPLAHTQLHQLRCFQNTGINKTVLLQL